MSSADVSLSGWTLNASSDRYMHAPLLGPSGSSALLRLPPNAAPSAVAVECVAGVAQVLPSAVPLTCAPCLVVRLVVRGGMPGRGSEGIAYHENSNKV